jgi:hypothetical protein
MERVKRYAFEGMTNIVRFNWPYYVFALVAIAGLFFSGNCFPEPFSFFAKLCGLGILVLTFVSLTVSWYIYDFSALYKFSWLDSLHPGPNQVIVNMHAGFDESSAILATRYPEAELLVFDFYDPLKHTEASIERARKAYPVFPGTKRFETNHVPLKAGSVDRFFLILAAHEIRDDAERILFFGQLATGLKSGGRIIVVEHTRDLANFMGYTFGFLHFLSPVTWRKTFSGSGLTIDSSFKITPFITIYILKKNGTPT